MLTFLLPALLLGVGLFALFDDDDDVASQDADEDDQNTGINERGTGGSDTLTGSDGDDMLDGRGGNDLLEGLRGADALDGGGGFDTLDGGRGEDTLDGGRGADILLGGRGADELDGGDGTDILLGGTQDDVLRAGSGDDGLYGDTGEDSLFGDEGDDVLFGADIIAFEEFLTADGARGVINEESFNEFVALDGDPGEADTLNGGTGDDLLLAGSLDQATGDMGEDTFAVGEWITPGSAPANFLDFDPEEDAILYGYTGETPPEMSFVRADPASGQVNLLADGQVVAVLSDVQIFLLNSEDILLERL